MNSPRGCAYIALGSNLGDRAANLREAAERLCQSGAIECAQRSPIYETSPVGGPAGQNDYLNAVIEVATDLSAADLLARCLEIERQLGRIRGERNRAREIDLDLLLFGDAVIDRDDVCVPHPRLHLRRFVLAPLADIAPNLRHPQLDRRITDLLTTLSDGDERAVRTTLAW